MLRRKPMRGVNNRTSMSIHITEKCNLKCPGCYTLGQERTKTIPFEYVKIALDKYQPKDVVFFGGEAILEPDLLRKIMSEYPDKRYFLHTNGTNYNDTNKDIYQKLHGVVLSLDSFRSEWLKKYKGYSDEDIASYFNLIEDHKDKIIVTHNIFASHNDPHYAEDMKKYNLPTNWYLFVTKSRDQEFLAYFRDCMLEDFNPNINVFPKLRLLADGTVTYDMRGVYNLFHVTQWDDDKLKKPLPMSNTCMQCPYNHSCFAFTMFPHFVKDILENVDYEPHFCKFTKIFWRYKHG